ncbi:hypothetical protein SELMODRAFT_414100 [Selaginella moellendorffii]|uniref:Uncharacterized protein n=1 Tax=Selaginella moellendorffii TaxID=88036 RepID=D8RRM8_SELML|nr:hypothetical protein SELMODRAFT_414100 [Selaginella moellendorffii]
MEDEPLESKVNKARVARAREVDFTQLWNQGSKVFLPFPGLEGSCRIKRPPLEFEFCSTGEYIGFRNAVEPLFKNSRGGVFILTGTKGGGKSSILRAFAWELIKLYDMSNKRPRPGCPITRIVCIWYLNVDHPVAEQIRDVLLFTFCNEKGAEEAIASIETPEDAKAFLERRRRLGERIVLLTDGEERHDPRTGSDAEKRRAARKWTDELWGQARVVVKALSPNSEVLKQSRFQGSPTVYNISKMFTKAERDAYLSGTVLGKFLENYPEHWGADEEYDGFREIYDLCVQPQQHPELAADPSATTDPFAADSSAAVPPDPNQLIEEYCHKLDWKMLVRRYKQDPEFQDLKNSIRRNMANLDPLLPLAVLFPAFTALDVYRSYRNKVLTAYARQRLADVRRMNWAELGWLIENFISEVICKKGMKLGDFKVPREFTREPFEGAEPKQVQTKGFRDGQGVVLLPDSYFFKYTDFVVITMNAEDHRKTEQKFVKKSYVRIWLPDLSEDEGRVHYSFFSPTKVDLNPLDKEVDAMEHRLHVSTFLESFADGITEEDCKLLEELEEKRREAMEKRKQSKKERRSKMDPAVLKGYGGLWRSGGSVLHVPYLRGRSHSYAHGAGQDQNVIAKRSRRGRS